MELVIPENVRSLLERAGWSPDRRVELSADCLNAVEGGHPAGPILESLTGVSIESGGAGIECATSDVAFQWLGGNPHEKVQTWAGLLGTQLVGVAEVHHAHGELYVAADGRCFGMSMIHDAFWLEGESFGEAVDRLARGLRSRPMLRPEQTSVRMWGVEFDRASPELYRWDRE
ncbi:MAG: SUKH-3 domain-containing protein [Planctomycetota bacterium]